MNANPQILLVEDTPELREDLVLELQDAGYTVFEAADGQSAITAFQLDPPRLIICDIQLPDMDGLSVLRAIRSERGPASATPIIVVSALCDAQSRYQAEAFGISAFIVKPVDYASLLSLIAQCLEDAGRRL